MADREAGTEVPGIRVVVPLFMTTEVFLWEDVGVIRLGAASHNGFLSSEPATSFSFPKSHVIDEDTSIDHTVTGRLHLHGTVEEPGLAYEMDALGLPLSFGTSKVSNNIPSRSKRKSTKPKYASSRRDINRPVPEVIVFNEVEKTGSSKILHDSPGMSSCLCTIICQNDTPYHDANEQYKDDWHSEESASIAALGCRNVTDEKLDLVEVSDLNVQNIIKSEVSPDTVCFEWNTEVLGSLSLCGDNCPEEVFEEACFQPKFQQDVDLLNKDLEKCSVDLCTSFCNKHSKGDKADTETMQWCSVSAEAVVFHPLGDHPDNSVCHEGGNWRVIWDSFYKSNYFFNVESHESTWHPPPGLEKYAFSCSNLDIKESDLGSDEKDAGSEHACGSIDEITDSLMKNDGSFHFTDKQPADEQLVETSAKMESRIDFISHCTTVGIENSKMQWSLYPSLVMNDMQGVTLETISSLLFMTFS
ncbi:hypothetical protein KSP40_PGU013789 [Platanthera guangdongensis]|uniref:WW domain-containing protein n=1 Tax=Platanthera guangdongensis TaxID=2320717 RepID=A0ABR2MQC4_9ASPA